MVSEVVHADLKPMVEVARNYNWAWGRVRLNLRLSQVAVRDCLHINLKNF